MSTNAEDLSEVHCNYIIGVCLCVSDFNENPTKTSRSLFFKSLKSIFAECKELSPKERCDYKTQYPQWLSILDGAFLQ